MEIRGLRHPQLNIDHFHTADNESWCFLGDNDSGLDELVDLLSDRLEGFTCDALHLPGQAQNQTPFKPQNLPAVVSFRLQQERFEDEIYNDDTDFLDTPDPGTLVREFFDSSQLSDPLLATFGLDRLLDHGYRHLSSGQSRKLLIVQKLLERPAMLVLQSPYDGLDRVSCQELNRALGTVAAARAEQPGVTLLLVINSAGDIPEWCSHLALFSGGHCTASGKRELILAEIQTQAGTGNRTAAQSSTTDSMLPPLRSQEQSTTESDESVPLIRLKNGWARYGDRPIFSGLDLIIQAGEHTLITGPNGCGKSTLLDIITGDNPCCYNNELELFGRRRGSGESIWELKQKIGIVSPGLHRDHRVAGNALHIIVSGLFDSIGLYRNVHPPQVRLARQWLHWLGMDEFATTPFRKLSFARQRLLLIARGLIKEPELLIMDEPTQGLDDRNRFRLLELLARCAGEERTTILYVSHRDDEYADFFRNRLKLDSYAARSTDNP